MTPAPRRKPPLDSPGPVRLATPHPPGVSPIDPPEDRRSEPKRGPTLPAGFERMFSIDDLAALLNCSRRLVERMRSSGKVPRPDLKIGKMPRWNPETIRRWMGGGKP
jgi:hypothetical protein